MISWNANRPTFPTQTKQYRSCHFRVSVYNYAYLKIFQTHAISNASFTISFNSPIVLSGWTSTSQALPLRSSTVMFMVTPLCWTAAAKIIPHLSQEPPKTQTYPLTVKTLGYQTQQFRKPQSYHQGCGGNPCWLKLGRQCCQSPYLKKNAVNLGTQDKICVAWTVFSYIFPMTQSNPRSGLENG